MGFFGELWDAVKQDFESGETTVARQRERCRDIEAEMAARAITERQELQRHLQAERARLEENRRLKGRAEREAREKERAASKRLQEQRKADAERLRVLRTPIVVRDNLPFAEEVARAEYEARVASAEQPQGLYDNSAAIRRAEDAYRRNHGI